MVDRASRILLVDDEHAIQTLLSYPLRKDGYEVVQATDGQAALARFAEGTYDLVVLDLMLPKLDGLEVCRRIRARSTVPIIMLTARAEEIDKVVGLEIGADDYITKPFSVEALVARVRAVLRRAAKGDAPDDDGERSVGPTLRVADLELDEEHWTVRRGGIPVELSPTEFRLLAYLMRNQGLMLSRKQLLENVWGWEYAGQSQVLETYVSYLRHKLDPLGPPMIHTQRGVGYSLRPP
jgi:two-component system OmpR family response regulator